MDTTNKNKRNLVAENDELRERIDKMEALVNTQKENGTYEGPKPAMYHDPFDMETNPHHVKKDPPGKVLGWKNPNLRNAPTCGWKGWTPVQYDDEIGQNLAEYIFDPPSKLAGTAAQDNYVRRGTDSILCWLDENIYKARQIKREQKALGRQLAASARGNSMLHPGVSTFGDGMQRDESPNIGSGQPPPLDDSKPSHRTELFRKE